MNLDPNGNKSLSISICISYPPLTLTEAVIDEIEML